MKLQEEGFAVEQFADGIAEPLRDADFAASRSSTAWCSA